MFKNVILFLLGFAFLSSSGVAFADLEINEIMYAPANGSEYEWVEIFNNGDSAVDLTGYRFFHGEANSGPLSLKKGVSFTLGPLGYAIIAKSLPDYSWLDSPSLMILSASTMSLPDSGDNTYIAISDPDKQIIDSVTYDIGLGADKNSGNSLQLISSSWIASAPTLGAENYFIQSDENDSNDTEENDGDIDTTSNNNNESSMSASSSKEKSATATKESVVNKIKILVETPVFVEAPASFTVNQTSSENSCGKYFWNFGDGTSDEIRITSSVPKKYTHVYEYEGEYVVTLECFKSYLSTEPQLVDKLVVKVARADILISRIGSGTDVFVEISNNTSLETDISGWSLVSVWKEFVFPKNSILKSKGKIIVSSKVTDFSTSDIATIKLLNPNSEIVFDYASSQKTENFLAQSFTSTKAPAKNDTKTPSIDFSENDIKISNDEFSTNTLSAQSISSGVEVKNNFVYLFSLLVFLALGVASVYFVRSSGRKSIAKKEGDDFEILEG